MNRAQFAVHVRLQQTRTDINLSKKDMHAAGSGLALSQAAPSLDSIMRVYFAARYDWKRRQKIALEQMGLPE